MLVQPRLPLLPLLSLPLLLAVTSGCCIVLLALLVRLLVLFLLLLLLFVLAVGGGAGVLLVFRNEHILHFEPPCSAYHNVYENRSLSLRLSLACLGKNHRR